MPNRQMHWQPVAARVPAYVPEFCITEIRQLQSGSSTSCVGEQVGERQSGGSEQGASDVETTRPTVEKVKGRRGLRAAAAPLGGQVPAYQHLPGVSRFPVPAS